MEKRVLLAIVLSFLVLVLYQALFVKKPAPATPEISPKVEKTPAQKPSQKAEKPLPPTPPKEKPQEKNLQPLAAAQEKEIIIDTSLYRAVWSNKGAVLKSWQLKQYKNENKENLELVSLQSQEINKYPFALQTEDVTFNNEINHALYKFSTSSLKLSQGQKGELHFTYADVAGNRVEKIFIFQGGKYSFEVKLKVWKKNQPIEPGLLWGPSLGNPTLDQQKKRFGGGRGVAVFTANKVYHQNEKKFKPEKSLFNFISWAAYEDNYFTAVFITSSQQAKATFIKEIKDKSPYFFLSLTNPLKAYIGPKEYDTLSKFGANCQKLIRFGFFGFIAQILLKAIKSIHSAIPNWGFCIIILTLIIKIIFFPLTYSSTRSMAKMQELQPKIKALRAKYKKAKQDIALRRKMNEEIMKLYKEHGINPAGGCLPMLVQIPIFWGFFRLLVVGIEFRQSPFIFWIKDLSVKDPYYVTPILMGITQFISQKLTPTSADPTQAKMMLIMPVVMTIFFMNFQSGLVLYWLTNNVLQIGQQLIMNRLMQKKKRESHGKKRRKK